MESFVIEKSFKVRNPYKSDEFIKQDYMISDSLQHNYLDSPWIAIDTEFMNLEMAHDQLSVIQLASPDPENEERIRMEAVWVWNYTKPGEHTTTEEQKMIKLTDRLKSEILLRHDAKLIMHVSSSDLSRLEKFCETEFLGSVFDTKVAARIIIRNYNSYGLAELVSTLVDPTFQKDKQSTFTFWDLHPSRWSDKSHEYVMYDVIYLHALEQKLMSMAKRRGVSETVSKTMEVLPHVSRLYRIGLTASVLDY